MMTPATTRQAAKAGNALFYTGKACIRHDTLNATRYASTGACRQCVADQKRNRSTGNPVGRPKRKGVEQ